MKKIYLGTSCYQAITFPSMAIYWFIEQIKKAGGNMTEFFLCFSWQKGWLYSPFELIDFIKDDAYPDDIFPLFDLKKFNKIITEKWGLIFEWCKLNEIVPFIRIQDFCSLKDRYYKRHYPFRSNKQRLITKTLTGGMWGEKIRKYYHKLNKWLVWLLRITKHEEFFIIPMNEADVLDSGWSEEEKDKRILDFYKWYIEDLRKLGVKKEQIIISTSRNFSELAKLDCVMEIHGINSDKSLYNMLQSYPCIFPISPHLLFPNGDGIDEEAKGRSGDKLNKREPSKAQAEKMAEMILESGLFGYAYFNRAIEQPLRKGESADICRAKFDILKTMADVIFYKPEPIPIPEPIPEEWGKSRWQKLLERIKKILCWIWKFLFGK